MTRGIGGTAVAYRAKPKIALIELFRVEVNLRVVQEEHHRRLLTFVGTDIMPIRKVLVETPNGPSREDTGTRATSAELKKQSDKYRQYARNYDPRSASSIFVKLKTGEAMQRAVEFGVLTDIDYIVVNAGNFDNLLMLFKDVLKRCLDNDPLNGVNLDPSATSGGVLYLQQFDITYIPGQHTTSARLTELLMTCWLA